uniref:Uncharacterized protein n=1 Tax=Plectus sambesii TaxID=2011161 RepID=A0A914V065_9BILA
MTSDVDCDCRLLSKQALGMDVDGLFTDSVFESFVSPDSRDSSLGDLSATNIPSMTHLSSYSPMSDDEKSHPTAIISVEPLSSESSLSDDEDSNMRVDEASSEC